MPPLVSILLPTRNSSRFLKPRIDSILNQTVQDWELLIADSFSSDGTWETFQELAAKDPRVSIAQVPIGLYEAWNYLIRKARGKYVYIATSDDEMENDCLEKMTRALEAHPECDLCDSIIKLVDANGNEISEESPSYVAHNWHVDFPRDICHLRYAPHDFYLHLGGKTVYTSITQLLIRRKLFEKTGLFSTTFGRSADYLWGMRAARYSNVVFLPEKLATWRIHENQITNALDPAKVDASFHQMSQMALTAIGELKSRIMRRKAMRIYKLIPFKETLLPAKRKRNLYYFFRSLVISALTHPILLSEFMLHALDEYRRRCPRRLWLIHSYDDMIRAHVRKLKLNKLIAYKGESNE